MINFCNRCGSQYQQNRPSCACNTMTHSHGSYTSNAPYYPHSHPNYCPTQTGCEPVIQGVTGRSINDGLWRVLDDCGKPVPYAWTEVLYTGTTQKAPVGWKRDMKPEHLYPMNPVQADHNGVVRLFYKGGPVDIIFYTNCNGAPGDVVGRLTDVGGFEEGDFPLDARPVKECVDIENPLVSIYDKDNCNRPAFLATPLAVHIHAMLEAGLPTAKYSDVKKYFQCLGEEWPNGVIVYSDCSDCPDVYIYKASCPEECPPDPCTVTFTNGESPCWTKCNLSICEQKEDQTEDATHALQCIDGKLVQRPIAADVTDFSTGRIEIFNNPFGPHSEFVAGAIVSLSSLGIDDPLSVKSVYFDALCHELTEGEGTASGNQQLETYMTIDGVEVCAAGTGDDNNAGKGSDTYNNNLFEFPVTGGQFTWQVSHNVFFGNGYSRQHLYLYGVKR